MDQNKSMLNQLDAGITAWTARWGIPLLRITMGIVFLWFGFKKFFPGASPADALATNTFGLLTFGIITGSAARIILAAWETAIGIGFIFKIFPRITILLFFLQMVGAFSPMVLAFHPDVSSVDPIYQKFPLVLTIVGQYIVKNIVFLAAALVIWADVRGGLNVAKPTASAKN